MKEKLKFISQLLKMYSMKKITRSKKVIKVNKTRGQKKIKV